MYTNFLAVVILVISVVPNPSLAKPTSYERETKPFVQWKPYEPTNPPADTTTTLSTTKRFTNPNFNKSKDFYNYNGTIFTDIDTRLNFNFNLSSMSNRYSECLKKLFKRMAGYKIDVSCTLTSPTPTSTPPSSPAPSASANSQHQTKHNHRTETGHQNERTIIKYFPVEENRIDYQLILLGVISVLLTAIVFVLLYTHQIKRSEKIIYMDKVKKLEKPIDNLGYLRV